MAALRLHRSNDVQLLLSGCQNLFKNDIFSQQPLLVCAGTTQALWYKRLLAKHGHCSFALKDIRPRQLREFFQPAAALHEEPSSLVWLIWQTLAEQSVFFEPIRKFLKPAAGAKEIWRYFLAVSLARVFSRYRHEQAEHLQWWNEQRLAFDPLHPRLDEVKLEELEEWLLKETWQLHLWRRVMRDVQELECVASSPPLLLIGSSNLLKPAEFTLVEKYAKKREVDYFLCEGSLSTHETSAFVLTMQTLANENPFFQRWDSEYSNKIHHRAKEDTLLAQLQSRLQGCSQVKLNKVDTSVRFFSCAGQVRQCEVLKNELLCWLEEHPQSTFEDIVIVAPQIELFTAALESVFTREDPFKIPCYFSSRRLSLASFFLDAFFLLLQLKESHFSYNQMQELFVNRCFKSRFPLEKRQHWSEYCQELAICYGYDLQDLEQQNLAIDNSWHTAWQRFFKRFFISNSQKSSSNLSTLIDYQALIETLEDLYSFLQKTDEKQPLSFWLNWVEELIDRYLCVSETADLLEEKRLRRALEKLKKSCKPLAEEPCFSIQMLENLLKESLLKDMLKERRPWAAGVCCASIAEVHTLPFKLVFVLGADEGELPCLEERVDFDLFESSKLNLTHEAHLFRHLILSAKQKIAFFFSGCSAYSGEELSPALFLEQLWQFLKDEHEKGEQLIQKLLEEHPLQNFSERYFQDGNPLFSYSQQAEDCFLILQKPEKISPTALQLAPIYDVEKIDWRLLSRVVSSGSKFFWQRLFPHFYKREETGDYFGRLSLTYRQRQEFFQRCSERWWQNREQTSLKDVELELQELGVKHQHILSKKSCEAFLQDYETFLQELSQHAPPEGRHGHLQFCLSEQWGKSYQNHPFIRAGVLAGTQLQSQIYGHLGEVIIQEKTVYKLFHYPENLKVYPAESLMAALLTFASCPDIDFFQAYLLNGQQLAQRLYSRFQSPHAIFLKDPLLLLSQTIDIYLKLLEMPLPSEGGIYKRYPRVSAYLNENFASNRFPELPLELAAFPLDRC